MRVCLAHTHNNRKRCVDMYCSYGEMKPYLSRSLFEIREARALRPPAPWPKPLTLSNHEYSYSTQHHHTTMCVLHVHAQKGEQRDVFHVSRRRPLTTDPTVQVGARKTRLLTWQIPCSRSLLHPKPRRTPWTNCCWCRSARSASMPTPTEVRSNAQQPRR